MQERREPQPPIPARCLTYAFQPHRHTTDPALSPGCGDLFGVSLGCAPSLHHLRGRLALVRRLLRYYERIRLLHRWWSRRAAIGLPWTAQRRRAGLGGDLPASVQETSRRVQGLRPRGTAPGLATIALVHFAFRLA